MSELEKTVADILVKATNAAEAAGKFAMEQLPDVAQQYVMYRGIMASAILVVAFLLIIFAAYAARTTYRKVVADEWSPEMSIPVGVLGIFAVLFAFIEGFRALETAVLAFFAPKILLIQWAATLVK